MRGMSGGGAEIQRCPGGDSCAQTVTQVAWDWNASRQTMHPWRARHEANGMEVLANLAYRPAHCRHQMPTEVEVLLHEMRRAKPYWLPTGLHCLIQPARYSRCFCDRGHRTLPGYPPQH